MSTILAGLDEDSLWESDEDGSLLDELEDLDDHEITVAEIQDYVNETVFQYSDIVSSSVNTQMNRYSNVFNFNTEYDPPSIVSFTQQPSASTPAFITPLQPTAVQPTLEPSTPAVLTPLQPTTQSVVSTVLASAYATLYTDQDCIIPPAQTFAAVPSSVADIMPPPPPPPPTDEPGPSSGVRARSPPPRRTNFYSSQDSDMMIDQYGDLIPSTRRT